MRGICLCGGLGARLGLLTKVTNKHLLQVYDKPMVFYPIKTLVDMGITEICLVTGGNYAGKFLELIGNGKRLGLDSVEYQYQEGHGGIADALKYAERFAGKEKIAVILGDNIFQDNMRWYKEAFEKRDKGASIITKVVSREDAQRFGVVAMKAGKLYKIIEKPKFPPTRYAVTGLYFYDSQVWEIIKGLKPSKRGELEITDVNNTYAKKGQLTYDVINGHWTDCGAYDTLFKANQLVYDEHRPRNNS